MSKYLVPSGDTEMVMTDNLCVDREVYTDLTANVSVRASEDTGYVLLDVTTEGGEGAGLYLNKEGTLLLIEALARFANDLA